jgi:ABC-2 type transport system permease protein
MLDAVRYEFVRLRSLRSTWVLFATGPVIQFLFAFIWATHSDMPVQTRFDNAFLGLFLVLALLPAMAVGVAAFGHEYRYRTIVTTTLTLRTPARILGAKAIVIALFAAVSGAALVATTLLAEAVGGEAFTDGGAIGQAFAGAIVFAVLSSLLGLGVAAVTRNATVALVAMIAFPTIIETLMALGKSRRRTPARTGCSRTVRRRSRWPSPALPRWSCAPGSRSWSRWSPRWSWCSTARSCRSCSPSTRSP